MTRDELTEIARHYQRNMTGDGFLFGAEEFTAFCNELIERSALREASAASNERDSAMAKVAVLSDLVNHPMLREMLGKIEDSNTPESDILWTYAMGWLDAARNALEATK